MTTVQALTVTQTLSKDSHGLKTNTGASGTIIVTLPAAADCTGLPPFRFLRTAAQTITVNPPGTEIIYDSAGVSLGAGVAKSLTDTGAYCEFVSDGTYWYACNERPSPAGALADGAVSTAAKLASDVVTTAKILAANVTGAKLVGTSMSAGHFAGRNGAGTCTLTGAVVGQRVLVGWLSSETATDTTVGGENTVVTRAAFVALFETAITVADQIQQASATDLSGNKYSVILIPAAS